MTTKQQLSFWFDEGVAKRQSYLLVYCDMYDYSDYPVFAKDVKEFWEIYNGVMYSIDNIQRLMEVYDLSMDKKIQMSEHIAMHLPRKLVK